MFLYLFLIIPVKTYFLLCCLRCNYCVNGINVFRKW